MDQVLFAKLTKAGHRHTYIVAYAVKVYLGFEILKSKFSQYFSSGFDIGSVGSVSKRLLTQGMKG